MDPARTYSQMGQRGIQSHNTTVTVHIDKTNRASPGSRVGQAPLACSSLQSLRPRTLRPGSHTPVCPTDGRSAVFRCKKKTTVRETDLVERKHEVELTDVLEKGICMVSSVHPNGLTPPTDSSIASNSLWQQRLHSESIGTHQEPLQRDGWPRGTRAHCRWNRRRCRRRDRRIVGR